MTLMTRSILLRFCTALLILLATIAPTFAAGLTIIVVDTSRPMNERWGGETKWNLVTTYIVNAIRSLPATDEAAIIGFGADRCEPTLLLPKTDALQASASAEGKLLTVAIGGDRALVAGLDSALAMASESGATAIRILAFTSGVDQCRENMRDLLTRASRIQGQLELQVFGLDMVSDQALEIIEGVGALGGTFRPFEGATDFTETITATQAPARPGLQVLVNTPSPDDVDSDARPMEARLEVYAEGGREPIWQQAVAGSTLIELPIGRYDVRCRFGAESRWRRSIIVGGSSPTLIQFDFAQGVGRIRLELADQVGSPMPGEVVIRERDSEQEVARQRGQSSVALDLAPGDYVATITIGSEEYTEEFTVDEGDERTISLTVEAVLGQALISVNNYDAQPINCDLYLYQAESGDLLETWPSTSSIRANLAAGDYEVVARIGTLEETQIFSVQEGDETEVSFTLDLPTGSLFVSLRDTDGASVYGTLRVFDSQGNEVQYYEQELYEDSEFSFSLPVGTYSVRANSDGVSRSASSVVVREDEESEVIIEFPVSDGLPGSDNDFD